VPAEEASAEALLREGDNLALEEEGEAGADEEASRQ
jgi:hypothetical protein